MNRSGRAREPHARLAIRANDLPPELAQDRGRELFDRPESARPERVARFAEILLDQRAGLGAEALPAVDAQADRTFVDEDLESVGKLDYSRLLHITAARPPPRRARDTPST
jgi:hypothetical protein